MDFKSGMELSRVTLTLTYHPASRDRAADRMQGVSTQGLGGGAELDVMSAGRVDCGGEMSSVGDLQSKEFRRWVRV